jgi:hypothetical protein
MKISNLKQYCEIMLEDGSQWIYRGQTGDYPLLPQIARKQYSHIPLEDFESSLVYLFERQAARFHKPDKIIELLILAQHYGLPTRLLDWTESPLSALWFATYKDDGDAFSPVVWRLFKNNDLIYSPHDKDIYKYFFEYHDLKDITSTIIYFPDHFDERIINQQSIVTIQPIIDNKIIELNKYNDEDIKLEKIEIDKNSCYQIQNDLNTLGINYSQIYPGLEGVCKQVSWDIIKKYT